jgi:reactive intermediate/imine deaminase
MSRSIISTPKAPSAIGTYSQAVRAGEFLYISGQIPLDPATQQLVSGDIDAEITRVFENIKAIAEAGGGTLASAVKVNVSLTDLAHFTRVNEIMATYFPQPWPARAAVGVAALPKGARVEVECVLWIP